MDRCGTYKWHSLQRARVRSSVGGRTVFGWGWMTPKLWCATVYAGLVLCAASLLREFKLNIKHASETCGGGSTSIAPTGRNDINRHTYIFWLNFMHMHGILYILRSGGCESYLFWHCSCNRHAFVVGATVCVLWDV